MRLTRFGVHGVVFYVMMLGAFYASPYSNLFFLLLGFLSLLGGGGILATRRNLRAVTAVLGELSPVPSESIIQVALQLSAPGPARFQIEAELLLTGGHRLAGRVDLLEGQATLALRTESLPRGCYAVERALLWSAYPFGIVRSGRTLPAPSELVVYPTPLALLERLDRRSSVDAIDELLGRADPGAGALQPASLRDHRAGDGVRRIHWRASARRARLVVQEWEGGSGQGLEVVLDRRCAPDELEQALRTVSALVHLARTSKETLRMHSQGLSATYGAGQRPWSEALRFLARAEPLPGHGPAPPATSPAVTRLPRVRSEGAHV